MRWGLPVEAAETRIEKRGDSEVITGYAAVYYRKDDPGTEFRMGDRLVERIMPGAFDRAVAEGDDVRALVNHDPDNLLGRTSSGTLKLETNRRGLRYEVPFDAQDPDHQRLRRKLERGDMTGSSFAFQVTDESFRFDNDMEIREIRGVNLFDVGPVTFPAYGSSTSGIRSEDLQEVRSAFETHKRQQEPEEEPEPEPCGNCQTLEAERNQLQQQVDELKVKLAEH